MRTASGQARTILEAAHDGVRKRVPTAERAPERTCAVGGETRWTPFARRWGAPLAAVSVALGVGAGYFLVPSPLPLTVRLPEAPSAETDTVLGMAAPAPRRAPLGTPFTLTHEGRAHPEKRAERPPAAAPTKAAPPYRSAPARLMGVVTAAQDSRAILLWDGQQVVLAPGESSGALTLLAVEADGVRVREAGEERRLRLPAPVAAMAEGNSGERSEGRG